MSPIDLDDGADPQDTAEVLDETNLTDDGENIANFDDIDDVEDLTQAEGDADDDEDGDPDIIDESELDDLADELEGGRDDEGLDVDREPLDAIAGDDEDIDELVSTETDKTADFESSRLADDDVQELGYAKSR